MQLITHTTHVLQQHYPTASARIKLSSYKMLIFVGLQGPVSDPNQPASTSQVVVSEAAATRSNPPSRTRGPEEGHGMVASGPQRRLVPLR